MSRTSDKTASLSLASSAVSFFLSGPDLCLTIAVDCLSFLSATGAAFGLLEACGAFWMIGREAAVALVMSAADVLG